jgi:tetratricopeptide (TPR) repeat protein
MPLKKTTSFRNMIDLAKDASRSTINTIKRNNSFKKPKTPRAGPTTEFSLMDFDLFLRDSALRREVNESCLHQLEVSLELDAFQDILHEVEVGLLSILKTYPNLDTKLVSEIHTYLGLVYLEQENNHAAVDSFTRAIWFKSRTPEDTFGIAKANHRLGLAYGRKKDYEQARVLLTRAIDSYETSSSLYVLAKADRHEFQEAEQLELLRKSRPNAFQRPLGRSTSYDHALPFSSLQAPPKKTTIKNKTFSSSTSSLPSPFVNTIKNKSFSSSTKSLPSASMRNKTFLSSTSSVATPSVNALQNKAFSISTSSLPSPSVKSLSPGMMATMRLN